MAKERDIFLCSDCGAEYTQWQGRCRACGQWNTLKPFNIPTGKAADAAAARVLGHAPGGRSPVPLSQVVSDGEARLAVGLAEMDRALGGGLVPGSAVLLAGDPGIGKSTLLLQALAQLSTRVPVLYVSGEESVRQIKMRAERLEIPGDTLLVLMENRLESILDACREAQPMVLAVDSIQTMASDMIPSAAGAVTQVRECAARLIALAKERNTALFLVGHVTKEGQIAGPRLLEHMVDTVLYFEGERGHNYRILRAVKNRFGAANEIGVFEMRESGLIEVANPSELFLAERVRGIPGAVVFAGLEGTRPVLLEIQSLVAPSPLAQPRRTTLGLDSNRLAMLTAVLERGLGIGFFDRDIFLNVAGGIRVNEPAADLATAVSLYAAHRHLAVDPGLVVVGEVGLGGEVRAVSHVAVRLKEAAKLGFSRCLVPAGSVKNLPEGLGIQVDPVATVAQAMERIQ